MGICTVGALTALPDHLLILLAFFDAQQVLQCIRIVLDLEHFNVLGDLNFFVVYPLYFNYAPLSQKLIYALFVAKLTFSVST